MQTSSIKNVLVTGANDGIGFETAKQLAEKGCRVLLHARNQTKAEEAVNRLENNLFLFGAIFQKCLRF